MALTALGFIFTILGVMFFFDKGLLAMGNVSARAVPVHGWRVLCALPAAALSWRHWRPGPYSSPAGTARVKRAPAWLHSRK